MPNKLQELTDRLYYEGLSKGREDGEQLLANARTEAEKIIVSAKAEAAEIISNSQRQAAELKSKSESDVRMASEQSLQATKKDIEDLLIHTMISDKIASATSDPSFIKDIIKAVAAKFTTSESSDLSLILPASLQKELEPWINGELCKSIGKGIKAQFTKKIDGGFSIGPKDGSWFISLTDDTFNELISEYMRPVTRKLLFG